MRMELKIHCVSLVVGLLVALASSDAGNVEEFDFIVVGAGTTGVGDPFSRVFLHCAGA